MAERHLIDEDIIRMSKDYKEPEYNGPERRKAINSFVDEYHERRKPRKRGKK